MSKKKQTIDDIIEMANTLPDDTIDATLEADDPKYRMIIDGETYTIDEAIEEVMNRARAHGEIVRDEKHE